MSEEINKTDEEVDNPLKAAKGQLNLSLGVFSESDHPLKASIAETDLSIKRSLKTFSAQSDDFVKKENDKSEEPIVYPLTDSGVTGVGTGPSLEKLNESLLENTDTETTQESDKSDQHIKHPLKDSSVETSFSHERIEKIEHQTSQLIDNQETETQTEAPDKCDQHIEYPLKSSQAETNLLLEKLKESDHQTTQVTNTDTQTDALTEEPCKSDIQIERLPNQTSIAIEVLPESFEALPEQLNDRNQQSEQLVESAGTQTEITVRFYFCKRGFF